ncbi:uncharacterized protein LOC143853918 [Tasmannia lanceolata]|uniref:uncharacterized protein LOC143853918 n=1 Tax=Tasmannia lanceolata TaxID=3420 RepID=UPI004062B30A
MIEPYRPSENIELGIEPFMNMNWREEACRPSENIEPCRIEPFMNMNWRANPCRPSGNIEPCRIDPFMNMNWRDEEINMIDDNVNVNGVESDEDDSGGNIRDVNHVVDVVDIDPEMINYEGDALYGKDGQELKWRISAIKFNEFAKVKRFVAEHTCTPQLYGNDHPHAAARWAVEACISKFGQLVEANISIDCMKSEWGVKLSYQKALIEKGIMLDHFHGNYEDSYRILPAYALEFYRANHGSHMYVYRLCDLCDRGENSFCRPLWAIGPCFCAWNRTLRPVVIVDGTHLRGKYAGILLIACDVDGNNQILLLAYAIVEGGCSRHGGGFSIIFTSATALRKSEFRDNMGKIEERNKAMYEWLMKIPKENWAGVYFMGKRYNVYTSNGAELGDEQGRRMLVLGCDLFLLEVKSKYHQDSVNLQAQTCTCGEYRNLGIPCAYAMAAIGSKDLDSYDFTDACYHMETLRKTYEEVVHPTLDRSQWPQPTQPLPIVEPFLNQRVLRRPRTVRIQRELVSGVHHKCSACGILGHNK